MLLLLCCAAACGGSGGGGDDDRAGATTTSTLAAAPTTTLPAPTTTGASLTTTTLADSPTTSQPAPPTTTLPSGPRDTCPANATAACKATFRLKSLATLGGLQFDVDYGAIAGCFKGIADAVKCTSTPQITALASFHDDDPTKRLSVGLISLEGITGPADVAVCDFVGASVPNAIKFELDVVEAVDPDLAPAAAVMGVTFDCDGGPATTSTTLAAATTTSTTSTTLAVAAAEFEVTFRLADAATLGALQVVVDYSQASGGFRGSGALAGEGGTLACTSLLGNGALAQLNDDDAGSLTMGFISLAGFTGPVDLARCTFDRDAEGFLQRDALAVRVEDATSPQAEPVAPAPRVDAGRIVAQ